MINHVTPLCSTCGKPLARHEIAEKLCGSCKAKQIAKKIEDACSGLFKLDK